MEGIARMSPVSHSADFRFRAASVLLSLLVCAWLLGSAPATLQAQSSFEESTVGIPAFSPQVPAEGGYINAGNGDVHIEIPLGTFPQRGGQQFKAVLMYDSKIWEEAWGTWNPESVLSAAGLSMGGWRIVTSADPGSVSSAVYVDYCDDSSSDFVYYYPYYYSATDGTTYRINADYTYYYSTECSTGGYGVGDSAWDVDASGYRLQVPNSGTTTLYAPGGTVMQTYSGSYAPEDSNGNYYTPGSYSTFECNGLSYANCSYPSSEKDQLGRTVFTASESSNVLTIDVLNSQGSTSTYTINFSTHNVHTNFGVMYISESSQLLTLIDSVDLPDGTSYSFTYDDGTSAGNYGLLKSMTLPTGGEINYTYANFTDAFGSMSRWLDTRTTPGGNVWTLTPQVNSTCASTYAPTCQQQATLAEPSGDNKVFLFTLTSPTGFAAYSTAVSHYSGSVSSTNLLATVTESYDYSMEDGCYSGVTGCLFPGADHIIPLSQTTTLTTGSSSTISATKTRTLDSSGDGNVTELQEWNFGSSTSGAADRTTTMTYPTATSYVNANIVNTPLSVTVTNSGGTTVAKTVNTYDGGSLGSATGKSQHDDTNYGTGNTVRGNLTQIQKYTGTSTYLTKSMTYDMLGNKLTETDWNGNSTAYNYSDNFFTDPGDTSNPSSYSPSTATNAYVKTITTGSLVTTFGYYWGTGQKAVSTDPNSETTYFHFHDALNRPTSTQFPDGGWSLTSYDTSGSVETGWEEYTGITSSQSTGCSSCRHDQTVLDSLGRLSNQILVNDPACSSGAYVTTTYDSNGRVHSVSNPYCTTSDTTYGVETYSYDGLDRKTQVTRPDSSVVYMNYGANVSSNSGRGTQLCSGYGVGYPTLTKDEAGALRQTWTDAFNRLIEVDEPDPSGGSLTSGSYAGTCYSYDLNNNLTGVSQGTETRSFSYDMLSRLTSATNPESGTTNYYYTASGGSLCSGDPSAVCRRVAPSPNQTSSSVTATTTYSYETTLNRLAQKSYADSYSSNPATPTAYYSYDYVGSGTTNALGRLSSFYTSGSPSTAGNFSYDPMGRVIYEGQWITTTGQHYTAYVYDLAGDETWDVRDNGSSNLNIYYAYDNAMRPTGITSSLVDSAHPSTLVSGISYSPAGGAQQMTYVNGIIETEVYNKRFQPCRINLQSSSSSITACTGSAPSANVQDFQYGFNAGSSDNGNIVSWNATGTSSTPTFTRSYGYDYLNRIATMSASSDPSGCTGLSWSFDRWGNRTAQTVTGGTCWPSSLGFSTSNQITNTGFTYDAAGNLYTDGSHTYYYDDENRLIQVDGTLGTCSSATSCYTYDTQGRRALKTASSTTTYYVYDTSGRQVSEWQAGWTTGYMYLNGPLVAQYSNSTTYFVHPDHLGSTRLVTSLSGSVVDCDDFQPFGEQLSYSGTTPCANNTYTTHKFTGKERDSESGLDNFGARYNSSQYGRFMTPDFANIAGDLDESGNPQTWNAYAYVHNNPLNAIDPDGEDCIYINSSDPSQSYSQTGDCTNAGGKDDNGIFVDGAITSLTYNGATGTYSYSGTNSPGDPAKIIGGTLTPGSSDPATNLANAINAMNPGGFINGSALLMAENGVADGLGKLAGLGFEAIQAARATKAAEAVADLDNLSNKIVRQMAERGGWTKQSITDTIQQAQEGGGVYPATNKATGGAATEFVSPSTGRFVVVDNTTKQVIQVSAPGYQPNYLVK